MWDVPKCLSHSGSPGFRCPVAPKAGDLPDSQALTSSRRVWSSPNGPNTPCDWTLPGWISPPVGWGLQMDPNGLTQMCVSIHSVSDVGSTQWSRRRADAARRPGRSLARQVCGMDEQLPWASTQYSAARILTGKDGVGPPNRLCFSH